MPSLPVIRVSYIGSMDVDTARVAACFDVCQYGLVVIEIPVEDVSVTCAPGSHAPALSAAEAGRTAAVLKALADPVRLRLFTDIAVKTGETCVCDLPDVGVSQPTVSHHLRRLREAGLIDSERRGTWVYYRATDRGRDVLRAVQTLS